MRARESERRQRQCVGERFPGCQQRGTSAVAAEAADLAGADLAGDADHSPVAVGSLQPLRLAASQVGQHTFDLNRDCVGAAGDDDVADPMPLDESAGGGMQHIGRRQQDRRVAHASQRGGRKRVGEGLS